jgi:hypothetical protein
MGVKASTETEQRTVHLSEQLGVMCPTRDNVSWESTGTRLRNLDFVLLVLSHHREEPA